MTRADIVERNGKKYVAITCDVCGKNNLYELDRAVMALRNGFKLYCKYCNHEHEIKRMDKKLERKLRRR